MEEKEITGERRSGKTGLIVFATTVSVFIIWYSLMSVLSPGKKMKELTDEYAYKQGIKTKIDDRVLSDSLYLAMLKEKAFFESRISMAETDSVYLAINLKDSTVNLGISGVTVHSAKMSEMNVCRLLEKGNRYIILSMLSSPLIIENDISSIKKEPLMISIAPKDTSEFQPDMVPDTADTEPVNYIFETQKGIRLYFYQEEADGRFNTFEFDLRDKLRNVLNSLKSVALLKVPDYIPYIRIRIPRADAKIIYRAIPEHGHIAVYI